MNYITFAKMIKDKRIEIGLTQKEMARKIPLKINAYFKIENGLMEPSFYALGQIAKILDFDLNEIFELNDKPKLQKMNFD